jgi:hypothetical protein
VSLSSFDRATASPANGGASITVYVSIESGWLNSTEQNGIMEKLENDYSFASTLINFTTAQPTSGSYHQINLVSSRDPDAATTNSGLVWGEAWSTSANVYGGEFTADSAVSSHFTNSTNRIRGIGETISHELDHILRGTGHSRNPGDINCDGTLVPASSVAADNRTFTSTDKAQKIRNILKGSTYNGYGAKEEKPFCNNNVMCVFGGNYWDWDPDMKPFNTWVTIQLELLAPPELFNVGFLSDSGVWDFSDGLDPYGVFSTTVPPGARLDFVLIDVMGGFQYPLSEYGDVLMDPGSIIDPIYSMEPVVDEPYFSGADLVWHTPEYGDVTCWLGTRAHPLLLPDECKEGFQLQGCSPVGVDHGDLSPGIPRLLQNFPNPFSTGTTIGFYVPEGKNPDAKVPVRLRVFDIQGRLVKELIDEPMTPGGHAVSLGSEDLGGAASGIYFYRLEVGEKKQTRKLMLLR